MEGIEYVSFTCVVTHEDVLKAVSFGDSNVILITFSVVNKESFWNVADKWRHEAEHFCPDVPIILGEFLVFQTSTVSGDEN